MSYTAMYRKFRPDTFDDVKGQEHIVTTLKNQVRSGRLGHAYLFCGTRGTGKTTVSKILAKVVNCSSPIDGNPCNKCPTCLAIQAQASMNVIEIDAASNNGVDNVREIVEEVRYSPTEGKYKVYIIDEVHMLSAGAFNALLKTLEEPPSYVIFILATTEVQKIPVTILSRCQRYDFKRISVDTITDRLKELIAREGNIEAEDKALRYIARMADGALRDALSLLDQCMAFYFGQKLTYDKVLEVLGAVDVEIFARLLRYIDKGSVSDCIMTIEEVIASGRDLTRFVTDFTWYLRSLLLIKTTDNAEEVLEVSSDQLELLKHEAKVCEFEQLIRYIRIFSDLSNQLKFATQKRVLVEVAIIKLCRPEMETDYSALLDRVRVLEEKLANGVTVRQADGTEDDRIEEAVPAKEEAVKLLTALPEEIQEIAKGWNQIIEKTQSPIRTLLVSVIPTLGEGNTLLLRVSSEIDKKLLDEEHHIAGLKKAIAEVIQRDVTIETKLIEKTDSAAVRQADITRLVKCGIPINYED